MKHTNLFYFESEADLLREYPDGRVDEPVPGIAYAAGNGNNAPTILFNKMVTSYEITVHSKDKSGTTLASDFSIDTPDVLYGNTVRMNIVAPEIEGYKARYPVEKVEFTSASTQHTIIYLSPTSYTITVNHMFEDEEIAEPTEIEVDDVFEEDVVKVKIEPANIPGYTAETVYIKVSGDTTYNLQYGEDICYVDLGLPSGTLWACKNLGAQNPEDYGDRYAWGEIEPTESQNDFKDWEDYRFYHENEDFTKYNNNDGKTVLELEDDAANVVIGGEWHIPTPEQVNELLEYTTCDSGHGGDGGYLVYTSIPNGNELVIPTRDDGTPVFWLNKLAIAEVDDGAAYSTYFDGYGMVGTDYDRNALIPIRPVLGEGPDEQQDDPIK